MKRLLLIIVTIIVAFYVTAQTYNPTTVYTRKLTAVQAGLLSSADFTTSQKSTMKSQILALHPNATFLADATQQYNCHSYAWHLSEGNSTIVWINQFDPSANYNVANYWTDGSFIQVCNETDADKIFYYSGDHSAVNSTAVIGKYESKWGPNIKIRHDPTDVPSIYNGQYRRYYASTKITGDLSNLCTGNRIFTVKNIPGALYTWTYSSTLSAVGGTNTNQLTVQRNGSANGAGWVQVQISNSCSLTPATSKTGFNVGIPDFNQIGATPYMSGCATYIFTSSGSSSGVFSPPDKIFEAESLDGSLISPYPTSYPGVISPTHCTGAGVKKSGSVTALIRVRQKNECGWSGWQQLTLPGCGGSFLISPNPTTDMITIQSKDATNNLQLSAAITEVRIFDNIGNIKKQLRYGTDTKQAQINVADLKTGVYFIEISSGQNKERQQLIIRK